MSYNGTGTFSINSAGQPVVTGTTITSTAFNTLTADLATGLSTALCKDGQSTPTANIGLGAFKITNLGAGTLATDAARVSQIQSGAATFITVTAADTILGTGTPALTAYATGNAFSFTVAATNTTAVTLNIDSLGAKAVTRDGSTALVAGDLVSGSVVTVVYDGTRFQVLNSNSKTNFKLSGTLTAASTATATKFIPTGTSVTSDGMYLPAANSLGFSTNGTERLRIDASGNVGLNKTPDAWVSSWRAIQGGAGATAFASGDDGAYVINNAFLNASAVWKYTSTGFASYIQQSGGAHNFSTAPSGTAGNTATFTQRFSIANGGAIAQATASSNYMTVTGATTGASYHTLTTTGGNYYVGADSSTGGTLIAGGGAYGFCIITVSARPIQFATNDTLRMTIGTTGIVTMNAYGAGTATFSAAGVISSVSDETWKVKDGVPLNPDEMLQKLEPGYWFYNDEKKETFGVDRQLGFYAQNVNAAIGPEAAPTPEEDKPWGYYDRSVLAVAVMSLQKALTTIQEQQALIESLTVRIAALEAK